MREYSLLVVLSRQHDGPGGHLRMNQVADAVVLSQSATTRLVSRLEDRGLLQRYLCPDDRRGIYTDVTPAGLALLGQARPTHDTALSSALGQAAADPELAPLVAAVEAMNMRRPAVLESGRRDRHEDHGAPHPRCGALSVPRRSRSRPGLSSH